MILKEFDKKEYNGTLLADIFRPLDFYSNQFDSNFVFSDYSVQSDDRPEYLGFSNGGNPELTWIYLHTNNVTDPFWGWITNETNIKKLSDRRYDDANGIHHHIKVSTGDLWYDLVEEPTDSGIWFDIGDTGFERVAVTGVMIPVTNLEYELSVNESKRNIKNLSKSSFLSYDTSMKRTIKESVDVDKK